MYTLIRRFNKSRVVQRCLQVLLSTMIFVITVVKMLWTHEAQPSELIDKSTDNTEPLLICFFTTVFNAKESFIFRA